MPVTPHRIALFSLALLLLALPAQRGSSADAPATQPADIHILYPAGGSVVTAERVLVLVAAPASAAAPAPMPGVRLDGQELKVERMTLAPEWENRRRRLAASTQPAAARAVVRDPDTVLLLATPELAPGLHRIDCGDARIEVFRAAPGKLAAPGPPAPAGWPVFHVHQHEPTRANLLYCDPCHDLTGPAGQRVLGLAKGPSACQACHQEVDLQLIHRHVLDPLAKCQICHEGHGAPRGSLLVDHPDKLCSQCHEGGHSKR